MLAAWKTSFYKHPKQLDYRTIGGIRPGRPLKRLLEGYNREAKTGYLLVSVLSRRVNLI
jgi:hypothetical protein